MVGCSGDVLDTDEAERCRHGGDVHDVGESFLWEKTVSGFLALLIFPATFCGTFAITRRRKMMNASDKIRCIA